MADLISVTATNKDQMAMIYSTSNSLSWVGQTTARVGDSSADLPFVYIIPFQLPSLTGGMISDVSLSLVSTGKVSFSSNVMYIDVLGIRVDASPTVLASDATPVSPTLLGDNVQLINQTVVVSPSAPIYANYTLGTSFFQSIYDNDPSAAGKFVFLILRTDGIDPISSNSYLLYNTADAGDGRPVLNITTIPEPATIGMLGLGSLVAILLRRIKG